MELRKDPITRSWVMTGDDPAEGAALAIGLMNHLGTRRCMLAIATHSTAVKLHAYSQAGFEAAAVDFDAEHLAPLYRLKPHTIGQSYGLAVARGDVVRREPGQLGQPDTAGLQHRDDGHVPSLGKPAAGAREFPPATVKVGVREIGRVGFAAGETVVRVGRLRPDG